MTGRSRTRAQWPDVRDAVASSCAGAGLDLVQPFCVTWYDRAVDPAYRLPDLGRSGALGILIGNSRALWDPFLAALRAEPARLDDPDPLDTFAGEAVARALAEVAARFDLRYEMRAASEPPPRRLAMQRLAHVSGLAHLAQSHLNVHPRHGPWIALRAAVVFDLAGPAGAAPDPPSPCQGCAEHCLPAYERAVGSGSDPIATHDDVGRDWPRWLAVRDACPVGRSSRYSDAQIRYHYTKDRALLTRLVRGTASG